jgi:hypothetical protein
MHRIVAVLAALLLSVVLATNVLAVSAVISPTTQTHTHGSSSHWDLSWGGSGPFDVYFWYNTSGGVSWSLVNTNTTTKSLSHVFTPCVTTTFHQELDNYDSLGFAATTSTAKENGGAC